MDKIKKDVEGCKGAVKNYQPNDMNLRQIENEYNNQGGSNMQRKFKDFEKKLDRLKFQGQNQGEDIAPYREEYFF